MGYIDVLFCCVIACVLVDSSLQYEPIVSIRKPYHPFYLKAQSTLELVCNSTERRELQWVRNTPSTDWEDKIVVPEHGTDFKTRVTIEEPSGMIENALYKHHMTVFDRGTYRCQDIPISDSYAVWIVVLHIFSENVTAVEGEPARLYCNVTGFDNNPPDIAYAWYKDDLFIPKDHPHYSMQMKDQSLKLEIKDPGKDDHSRYNCVFILATTEGNIELTHSAWLEASHLPKSETSRMGPSLIILLAAYVVSCL